MFLYFYHRIHRTNLENCPNNKKYNITKVRCQSKRLPVSYAKIFRALVKIFKRISFKLSARCWRAHLILHGHHLLRGSATTNFKCGVQTYLLNKIISLQSICTKTFACKTSRDSQGGLNHRNSKTRSFPPNWFVTFSCFPRLVPNFFSMQN